MDMATQCRSSDPNNNFTPTLKGYSLRPRATRKCEEDEAPPEPEEWRPSRNKRKPKSMPLSKYRRKTANARERCRMREINEAFESLRRVIPHVNVEECSSEKLTKITTLRLAMKYISALDNALRDQELESDAESFFSDYTLTPPPDLFHPLLPSGLPPFEIPLPPLDPGMTAAESQFDNSSYVFDAPFLTDFS